MKVQCQSCQAKYTVGDEKIGKKVFHLRCKKCSATIVIDGSAAPRDDKALDYAGATKEQWTVNVADGDQRTLTAAEIAREYTAGVVDDDTLCWKDGMDDWLPICEIEALYGVAKNPPASAKAPAGGAPAEGNGDGLLREASEAPPSVAAARRDGGRGRGTDLFGNADKAGSEEEYAVTKAASSPPPAPAPAARAAPVTKADAAEAKPTGARNESSLLFSLASLTSEATDKPADGAARRERSLPLSSAPSSSSASTSSPPSETSGVLDLRSLSANMDKDDSGLTKKGTSKEARVDEIMNLSGGGAFGTALAAPVLGLPASESSSSSVASGGESKSNNSIVPAILGGSALIAAAIVIAVVLGRAPATPPVGTGPTATTTGLGTAPTSSVAAADSTNVIGANAPAPTGTGEPSAKVAGVSPDKGARPVVAATAANGVTTGTKPDETAPPASAAATPAPAATPDKPQDFASALASAVGRTDEKPPENATGSGGGAQFDRGAAAAALGGIDIQGCKKPDGPTGPGHVNVTFAPDGSVASAVVDQGPFPGTAVGGCIAGKFRAAHVPAFGGAAVRVGKSFTLNN